MICASTVPRPCCFVPTTVCDSTIVAGKSDLRESNIVDFTKSKIGKNIYKTTNIWADTYVTFTSICTEYFRHHSECEAAPGVVVLQRCHGGSSTSRRTEWTHVMIIMVMVVSIKITVERAFNCMKYSQRKKCRRNILWRFLHKKVLLRWKEKSVRNNVSSDHFFVNRSNLLQQIESTKTIFFNKLNPTRNVSKAESIGTKKVNFPAQESILKFLFKNICWFLVEKTQVSLKLC